MAHKMKLPGNKVGRERSIDKLVKTGKQKRNVNAAQWWYIMLYMQGARNFTDINYQNGTVDVEYGMDMTRDNLRQFKYEGLISKFQGQLGRVRRIDLSPDVQKFGMGLDSLQKSSIARMLLKSLMPRAKVEALSDNVWSPLLMYGTLGACVWAKDNQNFGVEIVMPWEILPLPATANSPSEVRGLIRRRRVPVEWVKQLSVAPSKNSKVWSDMETKRVQRSENMSEGPASGSTSGDDSLVASAGDRPFKNETAQGRKSKKDDLEQEITELVEIWTYTEDDHLGEYAVHVGGKEIHYIDFTGEKRQVPMHVMRYIDTGGFWGRGFAELLLPMNSEIEYMSGKLFQNIEDMDVYGLLLEPTTLGIDASAEIGADGVKRLRYEPDYSAPDLKPTSIGPANPGALPGKVMETAHTMMDMLANQPTEMMQGGAPGRVDSSSGLGMILETANIPLTPVAASVASAISGCYRYILDYAKHTWSDGDTVRLLQVDDALAGITFDSDMGQMSLDSNAIPSAEEVNVTVASQMPRSPEREKMELKESLQMGQLTPMEYRIEVRKRGLDIPVGGEEEWQNYRKAVMENILLFNDGKKPGTIIVSERDMHEVHLKAHNDFMAKPEFLLASEEVRTAFDEIRQHHMMSLGEYPSQLPYPEQMAEQAMGQGGGGQGRPGGGGGQPQMGGPPQRGQK